MDVYKEFNDVIAPSLGLDKFRSKKVTKNFAFSVPNVKVPSTCDYLEVSGRNFLSINYDGGLFLNKKLEKFVFQRYYTKLIKFCCNSNRWNRILKNLLSLC